MKQERNTTATQEAKSAAKPEASGRGRGRAQVTPEVASGGIGTQENLQKSAQKGVQKPDGVSDYSLLQEAVEVKAGVSYGHARKSADAQGVEKPNCRPISSF